MSGKWSGGVANRTWNRQYRSVAVTGDEDRSERLFDALADEWFWCEHCGRTHPLWEHTKCRAAGLWLDR
jgi:hypothetical protein